MEMMHGVLTSLFKIDTEKGKEIGSAFTPLCHEFNQFLDLPADKKDMLLDPILSVMKKLGRIAEAVDRYEILEEEKMENLIKRAQKDQSSVILKHEDSSTQLEGAVEDVINSSKAALDAAVKILKPLWGINLTTYGDAGEKVVKALKRNIPDKFQPNIITLAEVIQECSPWIRLIRNLRTKTEHLGVNIVSPLSVSITDKLATKEYPLVDKSIPAKEFVNITYNNIFVFLQEFIVLSLGSRLLSGMIPVVVSGEGKNRKFGIAIKTVEAQDPKI